MVFDSYSYLSDDALTWAVGVEKQVGDASELGLLPASAGLVPFPATWTPRYVVAVEQGTDDDARRIYAVCNASSLAWINGPGTLITAGGVVFRVVRCVGERRFPVFFES